jgi:hypothetical protein
MLITFSKLINILNNFENNSFCFNERSENVNEFEQNFRCISYL